MKNLAVVTLLVASMLVAGTASHAETVWRSEDYIKLTTMSKRIVLIDVDEVKLKPSKIGKGVETRTVTVIGRRFETLRGQDAGEKFVDTSEEARIVDAAEAGRSNPADIVEILRHEVPHRPSLCQKGHRYLVIFTTDMTVFFEVSRDDQKWRKLVLKYQGP